MKDESGRFRPDQRAKTKGRRDARFGLDALLDSPLIRTRPCLAAGSSGPSACSARPPAPGNGLANSALADCLALPELTAPAPSLRIPIPAFKADAGKD